MHEKKPTEDLIKQLFARGMSEKEFRDRFGRYYRQQGNFFLNVNEELDVALARIDPSLKPTSGKK